MPIMYMYACIISVDCTDSEFTFKQCCYTICSFPLCWSFYIVSIMCLLLLLPLFLLQLYMSVNSKSSKRCLLGVLTVLKPRSKLQLKHPQPGVVVQEDGTTI